MKFAIALACLAGAVASSPIQARAEQAEQAQPSGGFLSNIFDQGACLVGGFLGSQNPNCKGATNNPGKPNIIGEIFDAGTCIVSGFIGGGNPNCGKGRGSSSTGADYTYNYNTDKEGIVKLVVTVTKSGKQCPYSFKPAEGLDIKSFISTAGEECVGGRSSLNL
ncbi:hypothetical protein NQ176_g8240 [Zarea fungicola]|uniref:Uncharacterized protein n=1 Tax=Zarea fungicola TaxID=93591 RepID=A0ACC1MVP2_9HYPO|nr:hypothetical protein NQ176_g8240 [Lecanicillium fungicola]